MNDLYSHEIQYRGRRYRYDPDFDCFYPITEHSNTHLARWLWLYACLVLAALAAFVTYV